MKNQIKLNEDGATTETILKAISRDFLLRLIQAYQEIQSKRRHSADYPKVQVRNFAKAVQSLNRDGWLSDKGLMKILIEFLKDVWGNPQYFPFLADGISKNPRGGPRRDIAKDALIFVLVNEIKQSAQFINEDAFGLVADFLVEQDIIGEKGITADAIRKRYDRMMKAVLQNKLPYLKQLALVLSAPGLSSDELPDIIS